MTKTKTSKKRAAKKTPAKRVRQSAKYQLTGEFPDLKSPQQLVIRGAMQRLGPATAAEIVNQVKGKLETKQKLQRVVSFYLTAWKKLGVVKVA
jgi:hypothetical protein